MKITPMLYNAEMVLAMLDGQKGQTRRICKLYDVNGRGFDTYSKIAMDAVVRHNSHYGKSGDLIYVRETCKAKELGDDEIIKVNGEDDCIPGLDGACFIADNSFNPIQNNREASDKWHDLYSYRGKKGAVVPSIHMPRWASRLTLKITDVRIERVQDIKESDALAEGIEPNCSLYDHSACNHDEWMRYGADEDDFPAFSPRESFQSLWNSIYNNWDSNPWVWVYEFEVIKQNVDDYVRDQL